MIDKILDVIFWFIGAILGLLPEWGVGHDGILVTLATTISTVDQYFPVTDLFEIMGVYLVYYGLVVWVRPLLKLARLA